MNVHQRVRKVASRTTPRWFRASVRPWWMAVDSRLARVRGLEVVHLLHPYKTGGTAVEYALSNSRSDRYAIRFWNHSLRLMNVPTDNKVMLFVREPTARFVSAFNFRIQKGLPLHHQEWTNAEATAFSRFRTANALAEALPSEDAATAMRSLVHLAPLVNWMGSPEYVITRASDILFVGSVESMATDFDRLCGILSVNAQLPENDIKGNRTPQGPSRFLSEMAVRNLHDWYADDYRLLSALRLISAPPEPDSAGRDPREDQ